MRLFMDTSSLIALNDRSDQYHKAARSFISHLSPVDDLITSNYIIDETITHLRRTIGVMATVKFAESIFSGKVCQIMYIDHEVEMSAFEIFKKFSDKVLSFTDCTSFALMKRLGISRAFAFDEDFLAVGFELVPVVWGQAER